MSGPCERFGAARIVARLAHNECDLRIYCLVVVRWITQQLENRRKCKAAALQESDLTRLFLVVLRRASEAAAPQRDHRARIVEFDTRERFSCGVTGYAPCLERRPDRASAEPSALLTSKGCREARVGEVTERGQLIKHNVDVGDRSGISVAGEEFPAQLGTRVLAAREERDRARL